MSEPMVSQEPMTTVPRESAIVEVSPQTAALVEQEMPHEDDAVKQETKALVEAMKKRAQAEMQAAGDITRDAYLSAVRRAREAIEQNQLIERDRVEHSFELLQKEAEKNWLVVTQEIETLGMRLAEAAKQAWEALMNSRSR